MTRDDLKPYIRSAEAWKPMMYWDKIGGVWTIGYGHNLSDNPISSQVGELLLDFDMINAESELMRMFPIVRSLHSVRFYTLEEMAFNMGIPRLKKFVKMWAAIQQSDWGKAADEILNSEAAKQVGARARRWATWMRTADISAWK